MLDEKIVDGKLFLPDRQTRYTPDPGVVPAGTEVYCGLCKTKCDEHRDLNGPRGFVQAMARGKSPHDAFYCPHTDANWHQQAEKLLDLAHSTPSKHLEEIYLKEAAEIVENKQASKEWSRFS
jgi:hypothetical protein